MQEKDVQEINDFDLGLDETGVEPVSPEPAKPVEDESVTKMKDAASNAAASAALKVAIDASNEMSQREADKTYLIEKKRYNLNKAKNDDPVEFVGHKIYAEVFGSTYTFLFNTIPVTVYFDGRTQIFPRFIYNHLMKKIAKVSESNTKKDENVRLEGD